MREERADNLVDHHNNDVPAIIMIEIGSLLTYLGRDKEASRFFNSIKKLRTDLEKEWGVQLPPFLVKENPLIDERSYRILFKENELVKRKVRPGKTLVISSKERLIKISSKIETDPIYQRPCIWVEPAESMRWITTEPYMASTERVILEHLEITLRSNLDQFVTKELIKERVSHINLTNPQVVHTVLSKLDLNSIHHIMRNLVSEGLSFELTEEVLKTLAFINISDDENPDNVTEILRRVFRDRIHSYVFGDKLILFALPDTKLQLWLFANRNKIKQIEKSSIVKRIIAELTSLYISFQGKGFRLGVICCEPVRLILRKVLEKKLPDVVILKPNEIDPIKNIMIIKHLKGSGFHLWAFKHWFHLWAKMSEKRYFEESIKSLSNYLSKMKDNKAPNKNSEDSLTKADNFPPEMTESLLNNLPAPREQTETQKAITLLLGSSDKFLKDTLSNLTYGEIGTLCREFLGMPSDISRIKERVNFEHHNKEQLSNPHTFAAIFAKKANDELRCEDLTSLQKLAVLISVLSHRTAEQIYGKILKNMPKKELENLVLENNDYKLRATYELKASVVEDFMWFYRGSCYPLLSYTPDMWTGELQRICLRSPKKAAIALRDLWLENAVVIERFDQFVYGNPEFAAFWIRHYISSKKKNQYQHKLFEKAAILIQLLPPELGEQVYNQLGGSWSRIFKNLPSDRKIESDAAGIILMQFLSHYLINFESGRLSKIHSN